MIDKAKPRLLDYEKVMSYACLWLEAAGGQERASVADFMKDLFNGDFDCKAESDYRKCDRLEIKACGTRVNGSFCTDSKCWIRDCEAEPEPVKSCGTCKRQKGADGLCSENYDDCKWYWIENGADHWQPKREGGE